MADGRIIVETELDSSGVERGLGKLGSIGGIASKGLGLVAKGITAVSGALVTAGGFCINYASDLTEVQNVVDTTFGTNNNKIADWCAKANEQFGLNELQAKQYTSTIGAMAKSSGITGTALEDMSTSLAGLSADFASFYNLSNEEAFEKIRAGISGESEPLKQLGINMSVANLEAFALSQGINKTYQEMTQAEQMQLRYNYLMQTGSDASGDFAKTLDTSLSNQLRVAKNNFVDLGSAIGTEMIPKAQEGMKVVLSSVDNMKKAFQEGGFTGLAESLGTEITNIVSWIADQLPAFIDMASKIINSLAQGIVDNAPRLAESLAKSVSSLAQGLATCLPTIIDAGLKLILELGKALGEQLPTIIPILVQGLIDCVNSIIENIDLFIDAGIQLIMGLLEGLIQSLPLLIEALPTLIEGIVNGILENLPVLIDLMPQIIEQLCTALVDNLPLLLEAVLQIIIAVGKALIENFPQIVVSLGQCLVSIWTTLVEFGGNLIKSIWDWGNSVSERFRQILENVINKFKELPSKIWNWLTQCVSKVAQWVVDMKNKAVSGISEMANSIVDKMRSLPSKMAEIGSNLVKGIWNGISSVKDWILGKIGGFTKSIVSGIKDFFGIHSPSRLLADEVGKYLPMGISLGFEKEMPNTQRDLEKQLDTLTDFDLSSNIKAMTSAVSSNYMKDGYNMFSNNIDNNINLTSSLDGNIEVVLQADGRVLARTVAPYQKEFTNYSVGRK